MFRLSALRICCGIQVGIVIRTTLPGDIKAAMIEVCGRTFWYKGPLFSMFATAGIPDQMYIKYEDEVKFKIARYVIADLERLGEDGSLCLRRLLTELCRLRDLADPFVPDRDSGLDALRTLKTLAARHDLLIREPQAPVKTTVAGAEESPQQVPNRASRLEELRLEFTRAFASSDRAGRGYDLERLLKGLFAAFEIQYRKSYRTEAEQIDGAFSFGGFDYIVETRWRADVPTLQELMAFKGKVDRKIESTRGFFVSVVGFREDIIQSLREAGQAKLVFMDGEDLTLILEGRVSLTDGLQAKADKASQEGVTYFPLRSLVC